jgi:SulP family sulfate permease
VARFPEAKTTDGVRIVRVDAALSFVNAVNIKKLLLAEADALTQEPRALVLDASGINDLDATGAEMLHDLLADLKDRDVALHVSDVKGPVRDVLRRSGLWEQLGTNAHSSTFEAIASIQTNRTQSVDQRQLGIDERGGLSNREQSTV